MIVIGIILVAVFAFGGKDDGTNDADSGTVTEETTEAETTEPEATEDPSEYYSDSDPDKGTKYTKEASWPDPDLSEVNMDTTERQTVIDTPEMKLYRVYCVGQSITVKGTCTGGNHFGIFVFDGTGFYEKTLVEKKSDTPIDIQFDQTVDLEEDGYHWVKVEGPGPFDLEWEGIL